MQTLISKRCLATGLLILVAGVMGAAGPVQAQHAEELLIPPSFSDTIICGDVNGPASDPFGNVTLADWVYLFNYLFEDGPAPVPMLCVADVNGDGNVSIVDLNALIKYLYKDCDWPVDDCCDSAVAGQRVEDDISRKTGDAALENIMVVESIAGSPGMDGLVFHVNGSWNVELGAYGMVLYYDTTRLEIAEISLEGTVGEGELLVTNYGYTEYLKAAAALWNKIPPGSGNLFKVVVNIKETAPLGETDLILLNDPGPPPSMCAYALADGINDLLPTLTHGTVNIKWICGDANNDELVTLPDVVYLINYILKSGPTPVPVECIADANGDTWVGIEDIVYLIGYIFKNATPPVDDCCW